MKRKRLYYIKSAAPLSYPSHKSYSPHQAPFHQLTYQPTNLSPFRVASCDFRVRAFGKTHRVASGELTRVELAR